MSDKSHINLVFVGHVDHGKSTIVGQLLYKTGTLTDQDLDKLKEEAEEMGKKTFEFAYVLDSMREERTRGVTIDLSHMKFESDNHVFTIIDAPGHRDFVKNMITGASQADAGVLVDDVKEGIQPQTKEHAYLSKVLGIDQLVVALNKMDLVDYDESKFKKVKKELLDFLKGVGYKEDQLTFIPTSGLEGENIIESSDEMDWWEGPPVLEALDDFEAPEKPVDLPLRLPLQDVYTITGIGTVPVGRVETGKMEIGDTVTFQPSNVSGEVKSIEMHHEEMEEATPGDNVGFNVRGVEKEQIRRGDVVGHEDEPPTVASEFTGQFIVLSHPTAITEGYSPVMHAHTAQSAVKFKKLKKKLDPKTGGVAEDNPDKLETGDAGMVLFEPKKPIVIEEKEEIPKLSSFAIRDMGSTIGAGFCADIEKER